MTDYALPVQTFWRDRTQDGFMGTLCTVTDASYTAIIIAIGVVFGFAQYRVERIFVHFFGWVGYWYQSWKQNHGERAQSADERRPLLDQNDNSRRRTLHIASARVTSVLLLLGGAAWIIAGTFVTKYPEGQSASSAAKECGLWGLTDDANPIAQDEDALVQGAVETRAGQYAQNCYGLQSVTSLAQCGVFKTQKIESTKHTGQRCPFENTTYCWGDGYTAAKFTTGLVEPKKIGLNTNHGRKLNRTTVCVPLDVNSGFVEDLNGDPREGEFGYKLGPVTSDEYKSKYTFRQYGNPFTFDVRSYTMSTFWHVFSKNESQNFWQPIEGLDIRPELKAKSDPYSITIMFINSCRIFYNEASEDPVFPADLKYPGSNLYINNNPQAHPLACIDWIEMCSDESHCVPPYSVGSSEENHEKQFSDFDKFDIFSRLAMNKSTIFNAIEFRGATGLDAQYKIRGDTSLALPNDQWVFESWRLFNTSLSRMQYDAFDIANGTGRDNKLYVPKMPTEDLRDMCGIFTFQIPKGYNNIRIAPRILEVGILILVAWGLAYETKEEFSEKQQRSGRFEGMKLLVFEQWCRRVREFAVGCAGGIRHRRQQPTTLRPPRNPSIQTQGEDQGSISASGAPQSGSEGTIPQRRSYGTALNPSRPEPAPGTASSTSNNEVVEPPPAAHQ